MNDNKCPFHGSTTKPNLGTQNKDWWPNNLNLDMNDEIISGSTFTHQGTITHEPTRNLLEES